MPPIKQVDATYKRPERKKGESGGKSPLGATAHRDLFGEDEDDEMRKTHPNLVYVPATKDKKGREKPAHWQTEIMIK